MKTAVKLAILLSVLLLVTGAAFATPCEYICYQVFTNCENGFLTNTSPWEAEICNADNANFDSDFGELNLYVFGGHFKLTGDNKWIGYGNGYSSCPGAWFFDILEDGERLKGAGVCEGIRCTVKGKRVTCNNPG